MKARFLFSGVLGILFAALAIVYKRLLDTEEKLVLTEAERNTLQREQDAIKESFMEANAHYEEFNKENPLPDDFKLEIAMRDAILSAHAREELDENHIDYEPYDDDEDEDDEV